jgi:hypothetical protein
MTTYFGESWCALTDDGRQVPTPIESECTWCKEGFVEGDAGMATPLGFIDETDSHPVTFVYYHKNCFLRSIVGSVGHQRKQCSCFGGTLEDPQELSLRQAADAAVREFEEARRRNVE